MSKPIKRLIWSLAFMVLAIIFVSSTSGPSQPKDPRVDENTPIVPYTQFLGDVEAQEVLYILY